jgi:hypothetical protein
MTVTLDPIRMKVFSVASGTLSRSQPWASDWAPVRSRISEENSAPKSITSEARNSQIPSLPL